jgi:hypothetical protein
VLNGITLLPIPLDALFKYGYIIISLNPQARAQIVRYKYGLVLGWWHSIFSLELAFAIVE